MLQLTSTLFWNLQTGYNKGLFDTKESMQRNLQNDLWSLYFYNDTRILLVL